ncbi:hypothetical protein [Sphaerisporangium fuscum]|uniref:hypothetical protein n=1 Tax=Sphaerisporangium fuscum TaxID=2835868 RepID=UPI001BDBFE89|nr:hypothetical protein [Sphaerisporangium fuscum]
MRPDVRRLDAPRPLRVPYVIAWSGEAVTHPLMFTEHGVRRLTYIDARPSDWVDGMLRARTGVDRGGEPVWRALNVHRQWLCMEALLCQVCGASGRHLDTGRIWWVVTETAFRAIDVASGLTNAPPTCPACVPDSLASCPQLRKSSAVYTVAVAEPVGVLAEVFEPGPDGMARRTGHNEFVRFDEPGRHPYILATQLVVRLEDMRPAGTPEPRAEPVSPSSCNLSWPMGSQHPVPRGKERR